MAERYTIPVLPLRDVVLFPGVTTPIGAGRPGTLRAIEAAVASEDKLIFAVSQRSNIEDVTPESLHTIGTLARIGQLQRGLGGVQLLLHGEKRAIAGRRLQTRSAPRRPSKPSGANTRTRRRRKNAIAS
ncbi:MAG: LON peptidase substrate-binding domain-containing protein, partial [Gemmatimonadota bacterium]